VAIEADVTQLPVKIRSGLCMATVPDLRSESGHDTEATETQKHLKTPITCINVTFARSMP
jgi:hypothetical protein